MSTSPPPGGASPDLRAFALRETAPRPQRWQPPTAPVLAVMVVLLLVTGGLVAVVRSAQIGSEALAAPVELAAQEPPSLVTTSTTTTVTTTPPVQETVTVPTTVPPTQPTAPPPDERAPSPIVKVGEIRIPKIGLVHPVYEGVTLTVVDDGPGHWPGSAMPGQLGNSVFAGHRVTHSHPFRNVDRLVPGDEILFVTHAGTSTYRVTKQEIVRPTDTWIVNPTPTATLTLFACHPPGSARQRIVVRADLVSTVPA